MLLTGGWLIAVTPGRGIVGATRKEKLGETALNAEMRSIDRQQRARAADYENYAATSATYSETRVAIGVEIVLGCLASTNGRRLDRQVVLDGGCGTGNYLEALGGLIGFGHGIDVSEGMLAEASARLRHRRNLSLAHGDLTRLPYDTNFFDGMMCNQVLHHLDQETASRRFPRIRKMLAEACRVLHPGGVIILNTCAREQLFEAFWWADLIPEAVGRMAARMPSIDQTIEMLVEARFGIGGVIAPLHDVLQGPSYLDPEGPLKASFRGGDSIWALVSDGELARVMDRIRDMNRDGSIHAFLAEREQRRRRVGQTTFVFARKLG